jgi:phosphohistidine phosphatase SixA
MALLRCTITALVLFVPLAAPAQDATGALPLPRAAIEGPALARHAATAHAEADLEPADLADCAKQRNLSEAGREMARAIGASIATLRIKWSEVLASPYCRTMETARLVAGRATESRAALGGMTATGKPDYSELDRILATAPPRGSVRLVVSHSHVFRALAGLPFLDEGEAAVLKPEGERWVIVARVKAEDWAKLAPRG